MSPPPARDRVLLILAGLVLAIPRLVRLLGPTIRVEDPNYAYGAYLISRGLRPHLDFAQVNLPYLEWVLGGCFRLLGPRPILPELLTALAAWIICWTVVRILWRRVGAGAALAAGCALSLHPLLLRYHLFEREVFLAALAGTAWLLLLGAGPRVDWKRAAAAGLLLAAAAGVKQSGVLPLAALSLWLVLRRDLRGAAWLAGSGVLGAGLLLGGDLLLHGSAAWHQVWTFHGIKGAMAPLSVKGLWAVQALGWLLPLGLVGAFLLLRQGRHREVLIPGALWCGLELGFDLVASSTLWPHYLIPLVIPLGVWLGSGLGEWATRGQPGLRGISLLVVWVGLVLLPILRVPDQDLLSSLGWGGTSREELQKLGDCIRDRTDPQDRIVAPPYEALLADRIKVVSFKDNWGLVLRLEETLAAGEMESLMRDAARRSFAELRRDSSRYWLRSLGPELAAGRIRVVVPNYELMIPEERLRQWGYRVVCQTGAGQVWMPEDAGGAR